MEFLDEDARPRFVFQSRSSQPSSSLPDHNEKPSKIFISVCISISLLLLSLVIFYLQSEPFRSLLLWISLSLSLFPFAPSSFTGGSIRVGYGPVLEEPPPDYQSSENDQSSKKSSHKRSRVQRNEQQSKVQGAIVENSNTNGSTTKKDDMRSGVVNGSVLNGEEQDWTEEDLDILKKQLTKNPAGKPGRWEVIAEAFNGRHQIKSVIDQSKRLGDKKVSDGDSYSVFLKNRKPIDNRAIAEETIENENVESDGGGGKGWSSAEDIALLNALKAFPKETPLRWEKIGAAVPGRSKASCMKRVTDLKKGFRSSKAGSED